MAGGPGRGGARQALAADGSLTVITSRTRRPREPEARARGLGVATAADSVSPAACSAHTSPGGLLSSLASSSPSLPGFPQPLRLLRGLASEASSVSSAARGAAAAAAALCIVGAGGGCARARPPRSLPTLGLTLPPIGGGHRASSAHAAVIPNLLWRRAPSVRERGAVRERVSREAGTVRVSARPHNLKAAPPGPAVCRART